MKIKTTFIILFIISILSTGVFAEKSDVSLNVDVPNIPDVGETFIVKVSVDDVIPLGVAQFTLEYNIEVLQCEDVQLGEVLENMLSATNPNAPKGAVVACASAYGSKTSGVLCEYTFTVIGEGETGFNFVNILFCDVEENKLTFEFVLNKEEPVDIINTKIESVAETCESFEETEDISEIEFIETNKDSETIATIVDSSVIVDSPVNEGPIKETSVPVEIISEDSFEEETEKEIESTDNENTKMNTPVAILIIIGAVGLIGVCAYKVRKIK